MIPASKAEMHDLLKAAEIGVTFARAERITHLMFLRCTCSR